MVDWQEFFFAPGANWPERLQARARRRFGDSADAESAYTYALRRVSEDGWKRLREGYAGRGPPDSFLGITFVNLLEEYAVRKYGRRRPPAWLQRLGLMWKRVYELLCLKRQMPEAIVTTLGPTAPGGNDEVRSAIREVRGRIPDCGAYVGETPVDDGHLTGYGDEQNPQPPAALEDREVLMVLGALRGLLAESSDGDAQASGLLSEAGVEARELPRLREALSLSDEERLLLKFVYLEGMSIARAARQLPLHEQKVRRMHKNLMQRLQEVLTPLGFGTQA